jgi:hypothetical protein
MIFNPLINTTDPPLCLITAVVQKEKKRFKNSEDFSNADNCKLELGYHEYKPVMTCVLVFRAHIFLITMVH